MAHARTRCVNSLSIYFFINIFIYILPALLFRRGTALFYTTNLHFLHHLLQIYSHRPVDNSVEYVGKLWINKGQE